MSRRRKLIRASEVGDYVYCRRSWWLRQVAGWEPGHARRLARGRTLHRRHGHLTSASRLAMVLGLALVVAALLSMLIR